MSLAAMAVLNSTHLGKLPGKLLPELFCSLPAIKIVPKNRQAWPLWRKSKLINLPQP
jgi:hypothetical protein